MESRKRQKTYLLSFVLSSLFLLVPVQYAQAEIVTTTCLNAAATGAVYEGTANLPDTLVPDCATTDSSADKASRKYLIYQHGKALEGWVPQSLGGTESVFTSPSGEECRIVNKGSSTFHYCYYDILNRFADNGFTVISFIRPQPKRAAEEYVWTFGARMKEIIEYLKDQGVPSENIILVGFSRGGTIMHIASYLVSDSSVKYVSLAGCLTGDPDSIFFRAFVNETSTYTIAADSDGALQATEDSTTTVPQYTYPQGLRGVALNLVRNDDVEAGACSDATSDISFDRATEGFRYDDVVCSDSGTGDVTDCSGSFDTGHEMFYQADDVWMNKVVQWINEPGGQFQFSVASYGVDEGVGSATITVQRTGFTIGSVTVGYATSDGTATAGADYAATSGTLTFGPGETTKTFTITIVDDSDVEDNETINLTLSNPTGGATLGPQDAAVLTIANNDVAFRFKDVSYTVNEAGGTATIRVEKLGGTPETVTVNYATSDGTAIAGTDYVATVGTLSWSPGDPGIKTFTVPIVNNTIPDAHRTVNLTLSNPNNPGGTAAVAAPGTAVLTILNDDVAFRFSTDSYSVGEAAGQATITVQRIGDTPPSVSVSVDYATGGGTATPGSDYIATTGRLTFGPGEATKTFTVTILDDTAPEEHETVNLSLSNPVNPAGTAALGAPNAAVLTILNDDVVFRFSRGTYVARESDPYVTITVRRIGATPNDVSVDYATGGGAATAGSDYVPASGTLTFTPGDATKSFMVKLLDDLTKEGNETVILSLSNPTNSAGKARLGEPDMAQIIILDDDHGRR